MRQGWLNRWTRFAGCVVVAASTVWLLPHSASSFEAAGKSRRFNLTLDSTLKVQRTGGDGIKTIEAWSRLLYDRTRRDGAIDVAIHSIEMSLKEDGQDTFSTKLSRDGIATTRGETTKEESSKNAVPGVRRILETFDTTAVTIALDVTGKGQKRTPKLVGPLAAPVLDSLDLILSIHSDFPADADWWETPARFSMEQGRVAQGTLKFEKVHASAGAVRVTVSGRLRPVVNGAAAAEGRTGSYTITGEQVYDTQTGEWRSAHWSIEMAFDILQNGKPAGSASGTVKLAMNPASLDAESVTTENPPKRNRR